MSDKNLTYTKPFAIGFAHLIDDLQLKVPAPVVRSEITGSRRTRIEDEFVLEQYPRSYTPEGLFGNLKFALRYEPIDLRVVNALFHAIEKKSVEEWVRSEPTGFYVRRGWYCMNC